ncbi:MAG TPA: thiamine pyrophosphate-binding protein, partial [Anaeromyxobacter sp.]|nr:thiamine pyrophosphate-binding protein [Anaeromyxobacter sp.]
MTGAELLLRTAASAGVDACFANPGTTELALVNALDRVAELRAVLCQFEGVASGAADGYARMADRPALALFHLGPGLANGIANLHTARRARTPLVALVGEHATWHRSADAPLASDIESLARPVSRFVRTAASASALGVDAAAAIAASMDGGGGVATLVVP